MQKIISFDLQGTLSDSAFSDEFWMTFLPKLYAERKGVTLAKAKHDLKFRQWSPYNRKYYDHHYWLQELAPEWGDEDIFSKLSNKPKISSQLIEIIQKIPVSVILCSATTKGFIAKELGEYKVHFHKIYSAIDDFALAGKPPTFYQRICKALNVSPQNFLHVGDCFEMDIKNAQAMGWNTYHWQDENKCSIRLQETITNFLN